MDKIDRIRKAVKQRPRTILAVGPMSKNTVDAVIELGNESAVPLLLIASRRQIEMMDQGGGYVNGWTTESFAEYVRTHDLKGNIVLARDHGGPWQNVQEVDQKMDLKKAMTSSCRSFEADIEAGFEILHLDPSVDIHTQNLSEEVLLDRLFELYDFCMQKARKAGRELLFEVGTEEQSGRQENIERLEWFLGKLETFCRKERFPKPTFVVVQTGTKVKELENVGILNNPHRMLGFIPPEVQIVKLVKTCEKFGIWMKEHNTDYLPDEILRWHPRVGIHAANVAPEFGVSETRQLVRLFEDMDMDKEKDAFLKLSYDSGKWGKWLKPDSTASDYEKAIIAGHYVFATEEFVAIKKKLEKVCKKQGVDLNRVLVEDIKYTIRRYMHAFNLY